MSASCRAARLAARPLLTRRVAATATPLRSRSTHMLRSTPSTQQSSTSSTVRSALLAGIVLACGAVTLSQSGVVRAKEEGARAQKTPVADHNSEMVPDEGLEERNKTAYDALERLLGDRCSVDFDDRTTHGNDAYSYHRDKPPWAIVYPQSTEEVSQIARICSQYHIPMIPYGSGTSLEGHTTAPSGGVVIEMSRMDRIKQLHEADMDVVVEPGITWETLNTQLKDSGLFYPVDPGPGASIGGMCGTSCSGTNAVRYGTMRQNVLNLTVVLADGTILKTAQRARKSSAGYNLTQLFVGSEGTLGIVTEATLRLQNIPAHTAVAVCPFESVHEAAAAASDVLRAGVQIGCVELLDEPAIRVVNQYAGLTLSEKPTIFFKFTGSEVGVKDEVSRVEDIVKKHAGGKFEWATEKAKREALWEGRKGALWATMAYKPENQVWTTDVCVPISRLADCIEATRKDIDAQGLLAPIVGHVGDGNFHVLISIDQSNAEEMKRAQQVNTRMVERAIAMEGTCTGEHGVGVGKRDFVEHELGVSTVDVMRKIKHSLDPQGLMNPGKIFRLKHDSPSMEHDQHGQQQQQGHEAAGGRVKQTFTRVVDSIMHGHHGPAAGGDQSSSAGGEGSNTAAVATAPKRDAHDDRPDHVAVPQPTYGYVAAPAGKPSGDPPQSKHDATPPPPRDK